MKRKFTLIILVLALPLFAHAKANKELKQYYKLTQTMSEQLKILKKAGECGNIGSRLADHMDKGINDLNQQKQQVVEAAAKGPNGKPELEKVVATAEEDFHSIDSHKGMVLWGLDGDKDSCVTATKAFLALHDTQAKIPDQVRKISASL